MPPLTLHLHERQRSIRIRGIEQIDHDALELLELDRLRDVGIEADVGALGVYVAEHVGRQRDHGDGPVRVGALPYADLATGLVAVFVGHVEVALGTVSIIKILAS